MEELPNEMLLKIFQYLDFSTKVFTLPLVCLRWNGICKDWSVFINSQLILNVADDVDKYNKLSHVFISHNWIQLHELQLVSTRCLNTFEKESLVSFLMKSKEGITWDKLHKMVFSVPLDNCDNYDSDSDSDLLNAIAAVNVNLVELHMNMGSVSCYNMCIITSLLQNLDKLKVFKLSGMYLELEYFQLLSGMNLREIQLRTKAPVKNFYPLYVNDSFDVSNIENFALMFEAGTREGNYFRRARWLALDIFIKLRRLIIWDSNIRRNLSYDIENLEELEELFLVETERDSFESETGMFLCNLSPFPVGIRHLQIDINIDDRDVKIVCQKLGNTLQSLSIYNFSESCKITESVICFISVYCCTQLLVLRLKLKLKDDLQSLVNILDVCSTLKLLFLCDCDFNYWNNDVGPLAWYCCVFQPKLVFEYNSKLYDILGTTSWVLQKYLNNSTEKVLAKYRIAENVNEVQKMFFEDIKKINRAAGDVLRETITSCFNIDYFIDMYRLSAVNLLMESSDSFSCDTYDKGIEIYIPKSFC